ncbi:MAG: Histidine kinase [Pedosphaera sp.]|nr:Histidine kinase [Pedosphaera sp.]
MLASGSPGDFNLRNEATTGFWRACFPCFCLCTLLLGATVAGAQTNRAEDGPRVILSESERAWVQKHPVVYCAVDPQWPPFSCYDKQGRIVGINVEMVRLLAKRTGLNIQLVRTPNWSETLRKAGTGEIDFVGGIAHTEKRKRIHGLQFTEVFCNFPTAIVTRNDMPFLTSLNELKSKRIAVPRDYATTEELQKRYPDAHFVITTNEEQSMLMVADNQADATVLNLASANYVVRTRGLTNLKISGFSDLVFFLILAVRKDAPELHSILEKGLATMEPREKETIYAGYIVPETLNAINWRVWRRRTIFLAFAGVAALTVVLFWNRSLAREIRQRKTAETALLQARDKLEARAWEMQELNEKLICANKDLESFSASVSHDLKSPLRRLRSFADLLDEDAGSRLDAEPRQYLDAIHYEVRRMTELTEALLALARIGRAELHFAPVNLEELTREIIGNMQVETQGREILWQVHPLPEIQGDRGLLKQVLANLIDNAVKFTREHTPARIEIGVLPESAASEEVVFYVKDNGAGFEMEYAGKLFETFQRLHHQEEYEGSGVGLANVKRIIQKHGGRVWAEGHVNQGATFYFSLPKKKRYG